MRRTCPLVAVGSALFAGLVAGEALAAPPPGQSARLAGMHDVDAASFLLGATKDCDKGWLTDLQYIGTSGSPAIDCHDDLTSAGVSIVQRLDVDGAKSFPPNAAQAPGYASAFAAAARQCPRIHVWIVGNEPNVTVDDSDPAKYAAPYAAAYAAVHAKVHALPGHEHDLVLASPASPYSPFCICSVPRIVAELDKRGVVPDGFALHAYTQAQTPADFGPLAQLASSEQMAGAKDGCGYAFHSHLRIYRDLIAAIEREGLAGKPTLITESGNACAPRANNKCYPDADVGYFHALYKEIGDWNADPDHVTRVRALTPYRWTGADDGTGRDFAVGSRPKLVAELGAAFAEDHRWTTGSCAPRTACRGDEECGGATMCDLAAGACVPTVACGASCASGVCRAGTGDCVPASRSLGHGFAEIALHQTRADVRADVDVEVTTSRPLRGVVNLEVVRLGGAALPARDVSEGGAGRWRYRVTPAEAGTYRVTFRARGDDALGIAYFQVGAPVGAPGAPGGPGAHGGVGEVGDVGDGASGCGCQATTTRASPPLEAAGLLAAITIVLRRLRSWAMRPGRRRAAQPAARD